MLKKYFFIAGFCLLVLFAGGLPASAQSTVAPSENLDSAGFSFDLNNVTHEGITGSTKQGWIREGANYIFGRVVQVLASVIGGLSVLMMSYGGFLMLASAGDETQFGKGRDYIKYALIGLAFTLLAYMLVLGVQLIIRGLYG
jgi:hypothetical protein